MKKTELGREEFAEEELRVESTSEHKIGTNIEQTANAPRVIASITVGIRDGSVERLRNEVVQPRGHGSIHRSSLQILLSVSDW